MRGSLAAAAAVAVAAALLTVSTSPAGAEGVGAVSADRTGTVSSDGTVTVSGTYSCSALSGAGPVFVSSSVRTGDSWRSIGGTAAVCDGAEHSWVNHEKPDGGSVAPGPSDIEATLVQLDTSSGLPLPAVLASDQHHVELQSAKG